MSEIIYSIVIPHYNIPDLLERALNSIPQREDIEVIVVDDNSDPAKVDFEHFPGLDRPNTHCVLLKKNGGAGIARNTAISMAKGRWILCVDADDFLLPNAFHSIDKYVNDAYDVVIFKSDNCLSSDITMKGKRNHAKHLNLLIDEVLNKKITPHEILFRILSPWCKLVKTELIKQQHIFFDTTRLGGEDIIWSTKLAVYALNIQVLPDYIYCLTERNESLSNRITYDALINYMNILKKKNTYLLQNKIKCYNSYFPYETLYNIAMQSKTKYFKISYKCLLNGTLEPKQFYEVEKKMKMKYPYLYLLVLLFAGYISLPKNTVIKRLWRNFVKE